MLTAVVDAKSKFLYNDASVLRNSRFAQRLNEGHLSFPQPELRFVNENISTEIPYYFIGDGGFGLQSHLFVPYGGSFSTL